MAGIDARDSRSLEANRHGQLSGSQRSFVYGVGIRWVISATFLTAFGGLVMFGVGNVWFTVLGILVIAPAALYLVSRSLDCVMDCSNKRVAIVTGWATPQPVGTLIFPFRGWREEGWERTTVGSTEFWLPPGSTAMSTTGEISVYFMPRSRVVVNVEFAASARSQL
jgi:hypothetical protein